MKRFTVPARRTAPVADPHVIDVDTDGDVECWWGVSWNDIQELRHAARGRPVDAESVADTFEQWVASAELVGYTSAEAAALLRRVVAGEVELDTTDYGRLILPPRDGRSPRQVPSVN